MQQFFMQDGQFKRGHINIYVIYRCIKKCLYEKIKLFEEIYPFFNLSFFLNKTNFYMQKLQTIQFCAK